MPATPGYVSETVTQQSETVDGIGLGVSAGPVTRNINTALQAQAFRQSSTVAGLADDSDRVAGDRCRAGHARPGRRHRQPAWRLAKSVLHPAQQSRRPNPANRVVASARWSMINFVRHPHRSARRRRPTSSARSQSDLGYRSQLSNEIVTLKLAQRPIWRDQQCSGRSTRWWPNGDMLITAACCRSTRPDPYQRWNVRRHELSRRRHSGITLERPTLPAAAS